jgi:glutamate dehydrogenase/leucine dehydrogenase
VDPARVDAANALDPKRVRATLVSPLASDAERNAVLGEKCDIVSPCGFGGVLNSDTCPLIQAKIVCGAANNQLLDPNDDYGMAGRGILYVPDYVANRMGIVNCANEQYGRVGSLHDMSDPAIARHLDRELDWDNSLFNTVGEVLGTAERNGITTVKAANLLSDSESNVAHPIWPDRSRAIIKQVIADGWSS